MSQRLRKQATYADVLAAPPDMTAEVIDGELYLQPRPRRRHLRAASALGGFLYSSYDSGATGPGGWVLVDEPELHLGRAPDILVPDIAAWRDDRYPGDVDDNDAYFTVAPDWVCEVLSDSTARVDRMKKMPVFARESISHAWIVDPRDRTVEVFRLTAGQYLLLGTWGGDEDAVALEPFDAVPLPPSSIWGRRRGA